VTHIVAIQHVHVMVQVEQLPLERIRNRRFSRTAQSREPNHRSLMTIPQRAMLRGHLTFRPEDVLRFHLRPIAVNAAEDDSPAGDLSIVDDDEPTHDRVPIAVIHHQRAAGLDGHFRHVVPGDVIVTLVVLKLLATAVCPVQDDTPQTTRFLAAVLSAVA